MQARWYVQYYCIVILYLTVNYKKLQTKKQNGVTYVRENDI